MSIDPGTHVAGLVAWEKNQPIAWQELRCSKGQVLEARLEFILNAVIAFGAAHRVVLAACERPFARSDRPAPELNVLFRRLRQVARQQGWQWREYHPSSVLASVRLRGLRGQSGKALIAQGVQALYGPRMAELPQDVLDAVAVGHCHLCKRVEEAALR